MFSKPIDPVLKAKIYDDLRSDPEANTLKIRDSLLKEFKGKNINKTKEVVKVLKFMIKDKIPSKSKFYALILIKELMAAKKPEFVEHFIKKLLSRLFLLAQFEMKDPNIKRGERCLKKYYPNDSKENLEYSLKFFMLLLECWKHWDQMFSSKYRKIKEKCDKLRPLFPVNDIYYDDLEKGGNHFVEDEFGFAEQNDNADGHDSQFDDSGFEKLPLPTDSQIKQNTINPLQTNIGAKATKIRIQDLDPSNQMRKNLKEFLQAANEELFYESYNEFYRSIQVEQNTLNKKKAEVLNNLAYADAEKKRYTNEILALSELMDSLDKFGRADMTFEQFSKQVMVIETKYPLAVAERMTVKSSKSLEKEGPHTHLKTYQDKSYDSKNFKNAPEDMNDYYKKKQKVVSSLSNVDAPSRKSNRKSKSSNMKSHAEEANELHNSDEDVEHEGSRFQNYEKAHNLEDDSFEGTATKKQKSPNTAAEDNFGTVKSRKGGNDNAKQIDTNENEWNFNFENVGMSIATTNSNVYGDFEGFGKNSVTGRNENLQEKLKLKLDNSGNKVQARGLEKKPTGAKQGLDLRSVKNREKFYNDKETDGDTDFYDSQGKDLMQSDGNDFKSNRSNDWRDIGIKGNFSKKEFEDFKVIGQTDAFKKTANANSGPKNLHSIPSKDDTNNKNVFDKVKNEFYIKTPNMNEKNMESSHKEAPHPSTLKKPAKAPFNFQNQRGPAQDPFNENSLSESLTQSNTKRSKIKNSNASNDVWNEQFEENVTSEFDQNFNSIGFAKDVRSSKASRQGLTPTFPKSNQTFELNENEPRLTMGKPFRPQNNFSINHSNLKKTSMNFEEDPHNTSDGNFNFEFKESSPNFDEYNQDYHTESNQHTRAISGNRFEAQTKFVNNQLLTNFNPDLGPSQRLSSSNNGQQFSPELQIIKMPLVSQLSFKSPETNENSQVTSSLKNKSRFNFSNPIHAAGGLNNLDNVVEEDSGHFENIHNDQGHERFSEAGRQSNNEEFNALSNNDSNKLFKKKERSDLGAEKTLSQNFKNAENDLIIPLKTHEDFIQAQSRHSLSSQGASQYLGDKNKSKLNINSDHNANKEFSQEINDFIFPPIMHSASAKQPNAIMDAKTNQIKPDNVEYELNNQNKSNINSLLPNKIANQNDQALIRNESHLREISELKLTNDFLKQQCQLLFNQLVDKKKDSGLPAVVTSQVITPNFDPKAQLTDVEELITRRKHSALAPESKLLKKSGGPQKLEVLKNRKTKKEEILLYEKLNNELRMYISELKNELGKFISSGESKK